MNLEQMFEKMNEIANDEDLQKQIQDSLEESLVKLNPMNETLSWFKKAKPFEDLTSKDKDTQLKCITEEYNELIDAKNQKEELDALADILVTVIGYAYMQGYDIVGALEEVNRSNFSKFEDGKPIFREDGKIMKGKDYTEPDLERFL